MSLEDNGTDSYRGIKKFIKHYNTSRPHQGIDNKLPIDRYLKNVKLVA